jgi:hypothetical protein
MNAVWPTRRSHVGALVGVMMVMGTALGNSSNAPIDAELLATREAAWRAFFGGDTETLGAMLPDDFIGLGMNEGPFADRATTLEASRSFRKNGGRLVRLEFPETRAQQFGEAVVLYGRYEAVLETGGAQRTVRGRLTETFVRRNGRWMHPGWHLDTMGPTPSQP